MLSRIGVQHPDIYLKKFFNLDFLLPAHETIQMSQLLEKLQAILPVYGYDATQTQEVVNRIRNIQLIAKAFDNMRDVVRFLNAFTISLDMFVANHTLVNISPFDLFCLTLIKHLRPDVYKKLRDRNAVIGEYSNSGNELIIAAIQKFPECKETFEELLNLQKFSSFRDMNLSNSKFVKMALESQRS